MSIYERIYNGYTWNTLKNYREVGGGLSKKKILVVDSGNDIDYVLIDFKNEKICQNFKHIASLFNHSIYCLPKFLSSKKSVALVEYVGDTTLQKLVVEDTRHKFICDIYFKAVDWLYTLKTNKRDINNTNLTEEENNHFLEMENASFNENKTTSFFELIRLLEMARCKLVYKNHVVDLITDVYNKERSLSHNDFHVGNIVSTGRKTNIKIVDYNQIGYNVMNYDIVSLVYSLQVYMSDTDRQKTLNYYYSTSNIFDDYNAFMLDVVKTAFIRICTCLRWRIDKYLYDEDDSDKEPDDKSTELLREIRRGLNYLKNFEEYIGIPISARLEKLLPENKLYSIVLCTDTGDEVDRKEPKCVVNISLKPMVGYVADVVNMLCCHTNFFVVGYKKKEIETVLNNINGNAMFVDQGKPLSTGNSVQQAVEHLEDDKIVIIMAGDMVTINYKMVRDVVDKHIDSGKITTIVTQKNDNSSKNARVVRNASGKFLEIVEFKDIPNLYSKKKATKIMNIEETDTGLYVFNTTKLKEYIEKIKKTIDTNEEHYYIADIIRLQKDDGFEINTFFVDYIVNPIHIHSVDDLEEVEKQFSMC